ncbi:MAG: hypothetical protein AMJ90_06465 [candidate division Zixibacteria bacterium SM23_73_2]|nr:MAG: hypothetical protein AMJ90_06465 [candidate division Zixibacteria bacterium SM23_73_2]
MEEKLISKDYRFILVCIAICVISLLVGIKYFPSVFPEATIDFKITREGSVPIAEKFLNEKGLDVSDYKHAVIFSHDDMAKVFLERELGLEKAQDVMSKKVKLWRWSNRWFKPLEKEEFKIFVSPEGEVIRFVHLIPEEKEGQDLSKEKAQTMAEVFLSQIMGKRLDSLEFVSASSEKRPQRTDHTFIWKDVGFEINDATYRYEVTVLGDEIGGYKEFLKVPDKWQRSYQKLRSLNETTSQIAAFFLFLTWLALVVVFFIRVRNRDIKWKTAYLFGIVAVVLTFLSQLNALPLTEFGYTTTESYGSFLTKNILQSLLISLGVGIFILLLTAGAEPLYREHYKRKISLTNLFTWKGIRTKKFFLTLILGFTLTFFFFAYQIIFYLIAGKLGAWAPADIPYSNMLNTMIPWIFVLLVGFWPAVSEEFTSRMFSIPFFQKYLKLGWLGVVIPAFIWGFAHANYPNQPFFIRGLEVGFAGIIIGIIMIRYNILALLVWHYTVDAIYTAFLMFRSGNLYFIISAGITTGILLIPLVVALVAYLRTKRFETQEKLINEVEGTSVIEKVEEKPREEVAEVPYKPLPKKRVILGALLIGVLLCLYFVTTEKFGDFVNYSITKDKAESVADDLLRKKGTDPEEFKNVTVEDDVFNKFEAKYVLEREGIEGLNRTFGENLSGFSWLTRYYKPLEKEEYWVGVNPENKKVVSFNHIIAEDKEGASLEKDSALLIAQKFIQAEGIDLEEFELKESSSENRKNRVDHKFVWEAVEGDPRNIDEAKFRMTLKIQGDEVSYFKKNMKIPEKWEREREKSTILGAARSGLKIVLIALFVGYSVLLLVRKVRAGEMKWKKIILLSLIPTVLAMLSFANRFSSVYQAYPTSIPLNVFTISAIIGFLIALVGIFILMAFSFGIISSFYPNWSSFFKKPLRKILSLDALICTVFSAGLLLGLRHLSDILLAKFNTAAIVSGLPIPDNLHTYLPFISSFNDVVFRSILLLAILGALLFGAKNYLKSFWHWLIVVPLIILAFVAGDAKTTSEFLFDAVILVIWLVPFSILIKWFFRNNLVAYSLSAFSLLGLTEFLGLISQKASFYQLNAIILGIILVIPFILILLDSFSGRGEVERTKT